MSDRAPDRGLVTSVEQWLVRLGGWLTPFGGTHVMAMPLAGFAAIWLAFDIISLAPLGVHNDLSEMSVWAQHFAFGYKHPPLSGWIFSLWFSIFPRAGWAAHLLAVTTVATALAVTWRLARDHLDADRALLGIASLTLVPLYTFQAIKFNANLVQMPFWAAALLFYLRARRSFAAHDAALAGLCVGAAFLGKYWAIYLVAGMAAASFVGPDLRRYWRSPAPYTMALAAAITVAPHLVWLVTERGSDTDSFLQELMSADPFGVNLKHSVVYLIESIGFIIFPLVFFAALRPSRAAIADTFLPKDKYRAMVLVLLVVPWALPAPLNLIEAHRLTPLWTFPNWALVPVVLFASPLLDISRRDVMRGAGFAAMISLAALLAAPLIASRNLYVPGNLVRQHWPQIAQTIERASERPVHLLSGSGDAIEGLAFYLPAARAVTSAFLHTQGRAAIENAGLAIACRSTDIPCQARGDALGDDGGWREISLQRHLLGIAGPQAVYRIKIISANRR